MLKNPKKIGGIVEISNSLIVEIDESCYFYKKYHRGAYRNGLWVFGGIERSNGSYFLAILADRKKENT